MRSVLRVIIYAITGITTTFSFCYPPVIHQSKTIFEPGDDALLTCIGNSTLFWNLTEDGRIQIGNNTENGGIFASNLLLQNISYMDSKQYECISESYDDTDNLCSSTTRLYVDDPENPFAHLTEFQTIVEAYVGGDLVIPCIQTNPQTVLRLVSFDGADITDDKRVSFRQGTGFIIRNAELIEDHTTYYCKALLPGKPQELALKSDIFHLFVHTTTDARAYIDASDAIGVVIGDTFTLNCTIGLEQDQQAHKKRLEWISLPPGTSNRSTQVPEYREGSPVNVLTVRDIRKEDQGVYRCGLSGFKDSEAETTIQILGPKPILEVKTEVTKIHVVAGTVATWIFEIKSFPKVKELFWTDGYGRYISNNVTFNMYTKQRKSRVTLKILKTSLQHAGRYSFTVVNQAGNSQTVHLDLNVTGQPIVINLKTRQLGQTSHLPTEFYQLNSTYETTCIALGAPPPNISWHFQPTEKDSEFLNEEKNQRPIFDDLQRGSQSTLSWVATAPGLLTCSLPDEYDNPIDFQSINIEIIDFTNANSMGLGIFGDVDIPEKTTLNLTCASLKSNSPYELRWFRNDTELSNSTYATLFSYSTNWSIRHNLVIPRAEILRDGGDYVCRSLSNKNVQAKATVLVRARKPPTFTTETNNHLNNTAVNVKVGAEKLQLECEAEGVPLPTVTWYKDGERLSTFELFRSQFNQPKTPRIISVLTSPDYHGNYSCVAMNDEGKAERYLDVKIEGVYKGQFKIFGIVIGVMTFFIVLLIFFMIVKHRKDEHKHARKIQNMIKKFKEGNVSSINSTLPVTDQVDLLPYDDRLEFPRDNLQIGKLLGHGAFGRVFKAKAKDLTVKGEYTNVAVKEAIDNLDGSNLKALASELKIMIHLGQHVNILNILGACTQDLKTGELLVIVEYCEFGNLLQYMQQLKQQEKFIDLRHVITREFNPYDAPASYHLNRWSSLSSHSSTPSPTTVQYTTLTFTDSSTSRRDSAGYRPLHSATSGSTRRKPSVSSPIEHSDSQFHSVPGSCCTDYTYVANDGTWNENDKPRPPQTPYDNSTFITTQDLICWSYQIACGMEYLTSRKVLHGDLAARNILLATNNIIKICDFGLSRQLYKNMYKKKKKDELLPIKWMAIESILEGKFSPFSDVWSYGVVLWELFSLGKTPYPGQDLNDPAGKFYTDLISGKRMEEPDYTPLGLYDLMLNCWITNPLHRPSFTHILTILEKYMTDENLKYYHGLNEPYSKITVEKMEGRPDYLQLMGNGECIDKDRTPDFPSPPTYENTHAKAENALRNSPPTKSSGSSRYPPLVNNDAYSSAPVEGANQETELAVFKQSTAPQTSQSVFINNGYVPNDFFNGSLEQPNSFPTPSSLTSDNSHFPSTRQQANELSSPTSHRPKLDSGVYSIESHHESPPSHSFNPPHDFQCDIHLKIDNSIQNQEYFQIITPPISHPVI